VCDSTRACDPIALYCMTHGCACLQVEATPEAAPVVASLRAVRGAANTRVQQRATPTGPLPPPRRAAASAAAVETPSVSENPAVDSPGTDDCHRERQTTGAATPVSRVGTAARHGGSSSRAQLRWPLQEVARHSVPSRAVGLVNVPSAAAAAAPPMGILLHAAAALPRTGTADAPGRELVSCRVFAVRWRAVPC
jgi:hypothetical protein